MAEAGEAAGEENGPVFEGIPVPSSPSLVLLAPAMQGAPLLNAKQYLYTYSDEQWEDFTVEWVRALGHPYVLVTRMGGAGDRGADVAACLTRQGTAGEWHCYQCKHYEDPLRPADAWPEMVKIFVAKVLRVYELPTRYVFVAPKIGSYLTRYLANPATLKEEFFKAWNKADSKLGSDLDAGIRTAVEVLAHATDFSMFEARDIDWIVELHSTTPHHARRFPTPLRPRPAVERPPSEPHADEAVYVQKLLAAYNEKYGLQLQTLQEARDHARTQQHLARQREAFYSAESLRVFARESVPVETYEAVETDLFEAVIQAEEREYDLGYERLTAVLDAAVNHQPNPGNILAPVITVRDRKGLCHHLANDKKLTWRK
ncbi:ABC-three component system protein [Streptomyces sp. NPDC048248]|uniref:ABC-three component system protein n=1 Tax=Streptomyces sp. NPDC048248 TaxID=3365523 RepID=UPI00371E023D